MIVSKTVKNIIQYITEGFISIFSPTRDDYPAIGVQPYGGTINHDNYYYEWQIDSTVITHSNYLLDT